MADKPIFYARQRDYVYQLNVLADLATLAITKGDAAEQHAAAALASKNLAALWATKTGSEVVAGQGYSAKQYAGDALVSVNTASAWATSLTAVSGGLFGARKYANDAASSATASAGSATAAAGSATAAAGSATAAGNSATAAAGSATNLANAVTTAQGARDTALGYRDSASTSATLASNWATALTAVSGGLFGARKYANDAAASAAAAAISADQSSAGQINSDWNATSGKGLILNKPVIPNLNGTFNIDGSAAGQQSNGLYVSEFTGTQGTTLNPTLTVAIAAQLNSSRSIALSVDSEGYLWGFRTHSTTGVVYTFKSKVKEADNAGLLNNRVSSNTDSANTIAARDSIGRVNATGFVSTSNDGLRMKSLGATAPAVILRNDASNFYFLLTDAATPDGTFNALRPMRFGLTSGEVFFGHNVGVIGTLTAADVQSNTNIHAYYGGDGQVTLGNGGSGIEIGKLGRTAAGAAYIDFHTSAGSPDYDVRLIASGGTGTSGQGTIRILCNALKVGESDVWHAGNLTNLTQLNNDAGFVRMGPTQNADINFNADIGSGIVLATQRGNRLAYAALSVVSSNFLINFDQQHHLYLQVTAACNATFNAQNRATTGVVILELKDGAAFPVNWGTSVNWVKGNGTGDTTTNFNDAGYTLHASGTDWIMFWCRNNVIYGKVMR